MITKAFEIRDKATFIPVVAILMVPNGWPSLLDNSERFLIRRSGYGFDHPSVLLCRMEASGTDRNATYDPYSWADRTFTVAHCYIEENWNKLKSGDVIDVEFILGETKEPKRSERFES